MSQTRSTTAGLVVRIIGAVLTIVFGVPFVLATWMALSSRFGTAAADPHGYGLIFGTFFALIAGILLAVVVPLVFRPARRGAAYRVSLIAYVVIAVVLILSLVTA